MHASTPAAKQLKRWRTDQGLSLAKAAKQIGVTPPAWFDWESGKKRPWPTHRSAIELLTGISASDWDTIEEQQHIERVRAQLDAQSTPSSTPSSARKPAVKKAAKPVTTGLHPRAKKGAKSPARPGPTPTRTAKDAAATGTHG